MSNLVTDMDNIKKRYREIFLETGEYLNQKMQNMNPKEFCDFLSNDVCKEICEKHLKILECRKKFSCSCCSACCKLACSEFSNEELVLKAKNGDNFASQFVSVFIPYESEEEAQKVYPEYFELLKNKAPNEKVYFYHCPKVTEEGRCPDYENRPQICRDFPDNPISFLPKNCGYVKWKKEVENDALRLHSLIEIVDFYKKKI